MTAIAFLFASLLAQATPAATVGDAMASGAVGERYDGFLDFVRPPDERLRRAVGAVNLKRRTLYTDLGRKRGIAPRDVGIAAGCKLLSRVDAGGWYRLPEGGWQQRQAGVVPVLPAYCVTASKAAR